MRAFYDPNQALHDPQFFLVRGKLQASAEQPERAERLLNGLAALNIEAEMPSDFGLAPVAAVHSPEYLQFLHSAYSRWSALPDSTPEVIPNIHPQRYAGTYPAGIVGQSGWHQADTACPIGAQTYRAARASANCAVMAATEVLAGNSISYALCRPPGHHAFTDMAGGFCFLNNAAIAAQFCLDQGKRVAIIDVDVHHGNGTQGIFYHREDVLTVSLHADPHHFYPFHWGQANERGEGRGEGYNYNVPLPLLTGDKDYLVALQQALQVTRQYAPDILIVALGLDASERDPLRGLQITTQGFCKIAEHLTALGLPMVLVQEGGYLSDILSDNLASFLHGVT